MFFTRATLTSFPLCLPPQIAFAQLCQLLMNVALLMVSVSSSPSFADVASPVCEPVAKVQAHRQSLRNSLSSKIASPVTVVASVQSADESNTNTTTLSNVVRVQLDDVRMNEDKLLERLQETLGQFITKTIQ